ncbi:MAG: TonB-dependent receptor plug domain-containing protein [Lachnoclostridium sp.]|nr:TonB-dependent receptor plug domain-containing protein [Lachnoclostridium sp.]
MKSFITILIALLSVAIALADTPFNGIITRSDFTPIKGAKVYVKKPSNYAKTDKNGRFGLTDVQPDDTLHIQIKKQHYSIPVDSARSMRIVVTDETGASGKEDLELINAGYGFVKRREYNSASNGISGERLAATGRSEIIDALIGLVPGLERSARGGVTLRGTNSFTSNTEPLYVVDGHIVPDFNGININSVHHVDVLKDGSFYGSRGAGGVIIVTTKTGAL